MPYIDFSQPTSGDGSEGSPYNDFTELNAVSGDRSGEAWYIKRGQTIQGAGIIVKSGTWNLVITTYGTGARPIIDCSYDSGVWTDQGGGDWSGDNTILNDGGRERAIIVNGVKVPEYDTQLEMQASGFGAWVNAGTTWVNLGGLNPNEENTRCSGFANGVYHQQTNASSTGQLEIRGLHIRFANDSGIEITSAEDNNIIDDNYIEYCGAYNGTDGPGNGILVNGTNAAQAQDNIVSNNTIIECRNAAIEGQDHINWLIERNTILRCSTGIELWGYVTLSTVRYNRISGTQKTLLSTNGGSNPIWLTPERQSPGVSGYNNNNIIAHNIISESGSINIGDTCDSNQVINNVWYGGSQFSTSIAIGAGTGNSVQNNICVQRPIDGLSTFRFIGDDAGSSGTPIISYNIFRYEEGFAPGGTPFVYNNTNYGTLAALETAQANVSSNLDNTAPGFTDTGSFKVLPDSNAAYVGTDVSQTLDYYGNTIISTNPSIGAAEPYNQVINTGSTGATYNGHWLPDVEYLRV